MFSKSTAIIIALAALSIAQDVPKSISRPPPEALPGIQSRLDQYHSQVQADPKFTSVNQILETAVPKDAGPPPAPKEGQPPPTKRIITTESWFKAMPTDAQTYLVSVASEEVKIITQSDYTPAPPGATQQKQASSSATGAASKTTGTSTSNATRNGAAASSASAKAGAAGLDRSVPAAAAPVLGGLMALMML